MAVTDTDSQPSAGVFVVFEVLADQPGPDGRVRRQECRTVDEAHRYARLLLRRRPASTTIIGFEPAAGHPEEIGSLDSDGWHPRT
ncbi:MULTISPECIES: hypothetical protein [Nocardiaceae]|uniref:DUF2188 domain-containing protein n=1 Tax=Rhodococcoides corynebacterioides TaxID=53972 RepID=A0ABS2KUE3_9NOCA|nr:MULTISPECIES: hypothetical protein [Rhodococcus]MBM7415554.1 hypothetical protein [Rhodococcus corynebacterioides]MBP1118016.1 hypothetical protein [Rhodococcus sp. PvP016]